MDELTVFCMMAQVRRHEEKAAMYLDAFNDNNHCNGALLQLFTEKGVQAIHIPAGFELGVMGEVLQELAEYHVTQSRKLLVNAFIKAKGGAAEHGTDNMQTAQAWAESVLASKPSQDPATGD